MHFQLRTDNHVNNSEGLAERVQAEVEAALLPRYANRVQRVEVYVQDTNARKGGVDKRCSVELHWPGHQAIVVHNDARTVVEAVSGAVDKLAAALEHAAGKLDDRDGHVPMSGQKS